MEKVPDGLKTWVVIGVHLPSCQSLVLNVLARKARALRVLGQDCYIFIVLPSCKNKTFKR